MIEKKIQTAALGFFVLLAVVGAMGFQFSGKTAETSAPESHEAKNLPVKGVVTMADLGANECIPCKMMAPILAKLEKKYQRKAPIVFVDVWKHRSQATRFGIRTIPTQIFFNKEGKEVYRHEGFMGEAEIDRIF